LDRPNSGHHHLLIDTDLPPLNEPIPNDFNHLHFGAGQTEAQVTLKPGPHTLQLLYRVYATTRKSSGEMIRKLSVIRSRKRSHFLVTVRLRKRRIADLNCAKVS
jgi:hypothetical protein